MKTTVISILILSFFSSNVAGVKPFRGLPPAQQPGLHPLAPKELPPIPGVSQPSHEMITDPITDCSKNLPHSDGTSRVN